MPLPRGLSLSGDAIVVGSELGALTPKLWAVTPLVTPAWCYRAPALQLSHHEVRIWLVVQSVQGWLLSLLQCIKYFIPGLVPSIFHILSHYKLAKSCEGISIIISILQRKKLRLRDIKLLVQDHH